MTSPGRERPGAHIRIKTTTIVTTWLAVGVGCAGGTEAKDTNWTGTSPGYTETGQSDTSVTGTEVGDTSTHQTGDTGFTLGPTGAIAPHTGDTNDSGHTGTSLGAVAPTGDTGL